MLTHQINISQIKAALIIAEPGASNSRRQMSIKVKKQVDANFRLAEVQTACLDIRKKKNRPHAYSRS